MNMGRLIALTAVAGVASQAAAGVILTYGFTDLVGAYDHPTAQFSAVAGDMTAGDVTRLAAPNGTARYLDGFVNRSAFANVTVNLNVFAKVGNIAQGVGTFSIVDDDGDILSGDISGTWIGGSLGVYFNGDLSNVVITSVSPDSTFDGPDGGSFSDALPGIPPYEGVFIQLFIRTGGFFTSSFSGRSVQVAGEIVPGAGSVALLAVAGFAGVRRRRN
ncbi:MAG: hypothetical protein KF866_06320 [Phycisphaeraceae bacterium]|nr:hypothetical protein [Phycisphaeraceae bacterium]